MYVDAGEVWEEKAGYTRDTFFNLCWGAVAVATDDGQGGHAVELALHWEKRAQVNIADWNEIQNECI